MNNSEIVELCLNSRKDTFAQLQKKHNQLESECEKSFFEEGMYRNLEKRCSPKYKEAFSKKQQLTREKVDKLDSQKKQLEEEITILKKEIEYLEELIKLHD